MFKLRKFESADAEYLCPRATDQSLRSQPSYYQQWAKINEYGPAFTALKGDKPIAAGGLLFTDEAGTAFVWAVFSEDIQACKKEIYRSLKTMLEMLVKKLEIKKLIAGCPREFPAAARLLVHLGFKKTEQIVEEKEVWVRNG